MRSIIGISLNINVKIQNGPRKKVAWSVSQHKYRNYADGNGRAATFWPILYIERYSQHIPVNGAAF